MASEDRVGPWADKGWEAFRVASQIMVERWGVMSLAVEQEFGGHDTRQKYEHLMDDLLLNCDEMWGRQKIVPPETFDEFFMEAMEHDFNTRIQDGSCWAIAHELANCYERCARGDLADTNTLIAEALAEKERARGRPRASAARRAGADSSDDEGAAPSGATAAAGGAGGAGGAASAGGEAAGEAASGAAADAEASTEGGAGEAAAEDDGWEVVPKRRGKGRR